MAASSSSPKTFDPTCRATFKSSSTTVECLKTRCAQTYLSTNWIKIREPRFTEHDRFISLMVKSRCKRARSKVIHSSGYGRNWLLGGQDRKRPSYHQICRRLRVCREYR